MELIGWRTEGTTAPGRRVRRGLLLAILLVALNLRPAIGSVLPLLETIRADLGLSHAATSLLVAVPTLCMGVFAFAAPPLSRRLGRFRAVFWAVILVGVATAIRYLGSAAPILFASTVLVGIGIAVCQTLLPTIVSQYFPGDEARVTGLYTACLIGGAGLASSGTTALQAVVSAWPTALAIWAVPVVPAVVCWLGKGSGTPHRGETPAVTSWDVRDVSARSPWYLTCIYGVAAILFFTSLTWIAPRYEDLGWSVERAGGLVTLLIFAQLVGALATSTIANRSPDRRPWYVVTNSVLVVGLVGVAHLPLVTPIGWTVGIGYGTGSLFALVLTLPIDYATNPTETDRLSSIVLGGGYLLGTVGPPLAGWVRGTSGTYWWPFILLAGLACLLAVASLGLTPE